MHIVTAPDSVPTYQPVLFLAGGISNCPLWQDEALSLLTNEQITVANPRRPGVLPAEEAEAQIRWEYDALRRSDAILFWFPEETLCPITLFELGTHAERGVPLAVGTHPRYARRLDVIVQMEMRRPEIQVAFDLPTVVRTAANLVR